MFQFIFLEQLLVKLFNDSGMFDKKKSKVTLIKKKDLSKKDQDEMLKRGTLQRSGYFQIWYIRSNYSKSFS